MRRMVLLFCIASAALLPARSVAETAPTAEQLAFFEKSIRPVLVDHCYKCHSAKAEKIKGKLVLDTREGVRKGGATGPAIVPGEPAKSLLIRSLSHTHDGLKMPPKGKLPDAVIADFEKWVRMGAPDPRDGKAYVAKAIDIEKGRQFWAFRRPQRIAPPVVQNADWPRSDIDRFLLAGMEAKKLRPVADADRATLLRRITLDLTGLPPTEDEVLAFLADNSPSALPRLVDRLLASPAFGERWGRHWLDVARYAESSGKSVNFSYPHAWRYRDWVIQALNSDLPYDQFVAQQVAGDLLPADNERQRALQQIATGFLAIGPKPHNERNALQFRMDVVDEQIDTLSQAFLGLTVSCARCHDHKFDPIPMRDYYALAGIFRSTEARYGTVRIIQNNHPSRLLELPGDVGLPVGLSPLTAEARTKIQGQIDQLKKDREKAFADRKNININQSIFINIRLATLESQLDSYQADGAPKIRAMGVRERFLIADSPIFERGEVDKPGKTVPRGTLQVLQDQPLRIKGSGRRELAQWLVKENPLTARVMVNRVWHHLFGRGIVSTPDNFGEAGDRPSHPELLDYLAVSFEENGWSVKDLIRRIVLSRAYQLSTRHNAANFEADPDNTLVWRMSKRRHDAEILRDGMLCVAGELDREPMEGSATQKAGEGYVRGAFGFAAPQDPGRGKRSVYLPVVRDQPLEALALFDFASPDVVSGERATTTVPAQALYLLNNPFVQRQAEKAADRLLRETSASDRIRVAHLRFVGRPPTVSEVKAAETFFEAYTRQLTREGKARFTIQRASWSAYCQALFASADFLYRN